MYRTKQLYGAIEAGGTKFICAIGDQDGEILDETRIETRDPAATLADVCRYFAGATHRFCPLTALGVGAFGPLDLQDHLAHLRIHHQHAETGMDAIRTWPGR